MRNRCLLRLCRRLKGLPELGGKSAEALRPVVERWHALASPVIRTKPFSESWAEFCAAWPRTHTAQHEGLGGVVLPEGGTTLERLAALMPQVRHLSARKAGQLLGVSPMTGWRHIQKLIEAGLVAVVRPGDKYRPGVRLKAAEYQYIGQAIADDAQGESLARAPGRQAA
jgi:hypothetical protein